MRNLLRFKMFEKLSQSDVENLDRKDIEDLKEEIRKEKLKFEDFYKYELYLLSKKVCNKLNIPEDILKIELNILKGYNIRDYLKFKSTGFEFIISDDGDYRKVSGGAWLDNIAKSGNKLFKYIRNDYGSDIEMQKAVGSKLELIFENSERLRELYVRLHELEGKSSENEDVIKQELINYIIDNNIVIELKNDEHNTSPGAKKNVKFLAKGKDGSVTFNITDSGIYKADIRGVSTGGAYGKRNYYIDNNKVILLKSIRAKKIRNLISGLRRYGVLDSYDFKRVVNEFIKKNNNNNNNI